jgi:hypothetical protein
MTVSAPDATGVMKALSGVRVSAYARDTTSAVKIYRNHDGTTQGPTAESGATGTNPFTTGATGNVEFWCDGPAEIDVLIEDLTTPPRIITRTVGWNCIPAATGSLPTSMLSGDAALDLDALGPEILRQLTQIGQVIDWWRPASSVPLPSGFEICDGHQVAAGQHEFPGLSTSAINLPDLRNAFVLGADSTKTDSQNATLVDTAAGAPGIRGAGGSQMHSLLTTEMPSHQHAPGTLKTDVEADHGHANTLATGLESAAHSHAITVNANDAVNGTVAGGKVPVGWPDTVWTGAKGPAGTPGYPRLGAQADITVLSSQLSHSHSASSGTESANHNHAITGGVSPGGGHDHLIIGASEAVGGSATHNNTPRYVGLLKLMKVRRS